MAGSGDGRAEGRADQPAGARSRQGSPGSRGGSPEDEDREPDIGERVTEAGKGALGLWLHLVDAWDPRKNIFSLWPRKGADRQRLPVLDGLRAVALGWLVIAVAYAGAFSTDAPTYLVASQYALNSDLARDILLLVSGMCISAVILAEVEDTCDFSIRRFYWRRFLALWPPLAVALLITYLFDPGARSSCSTYWWAILLFINNYAGDQKCMPQTWLVAVLFQLYLLTPLLMFACVNYQAATIRRYTSGYILLTFLSLLSVVISWIFYNFDIFTYSPDGWPAVPYLTGTLLRWSPYLTGMTTALMLWDQSIPYEQTKGEQEKRRQNMPTYEVIEENQPISCREATGRILDYLLDALSVAVILVIVIEGTQQDDAYVSTLLRVWFGWALGRIIYRILKGPYQVVLKMMSVPVFFTSSQLAYSSLVTQALIFVDVRELLGLSTTPLDTTDDLYLFSVSFCIYTASIAAAAFGMFMLLAEPILRLRPFRHEVSTPQRNETGKDSPDPPDVPKPLQRIKSKEKMVISSFGAMSRPHSTVTIRSGTTTAIETFPNSFGPEAGKQYFNGLMPSLDSENGYWVNTVVTAYNEGGEDLADTLLSIHENVENLKAGCDIHVIVILDGWNKMSTSMRGYLKRLYPGNDVEQQIAITAFKKDQEIPDPTWMSHIDKTKEAEWYDEKLPVTFTLQQLEGNLLAPVDVGPGKSMYVSCIIKYDNRRKHNSHEWFLRAFAMQYEAKYLYLTDVGTTAHRFCIPRLTRFMDRHTDFCAATGFQRTQKLKPGATVVEHLQREVQLYELGPSLCSCIKAAQGMFGYVVILSGPCQIVRCSDALDERFLESFFQMINQDPSEIGICHANMQLTEDIVFAGALYGVTRGKKIGYVPNAYFNYDVEVAPDRFLKQRRRWHNGILGAILSKMSPFSGLWDYSHQTIWRRIVTATVLTHQSTILTQYLILPSVYMYNIFNLLGGYGVAPLPAGAFPVLSAIGEALGPLKDAIPYLGVLSYFAVLAAWIFAHNRKEYIPWFYYIMLAISLIIGLGIVAVGVEFVIEVTSNQAEDPVYGAFVVSMIAILLLSPVVSAILTLDWSGLATTIVNLPFFLSFIPVYILTSAYGISRFGDMTWGNRPHEGETRDGSARNAYMESARSLGMLAIWLYLGVNASLAVLLIIGGFLWDGNAALIFFFFLTPFTLWAALGMFYNLWYGARYCWGIPGTGAPRSRRDDIDNKPQPRWTSDRGNIGQAAAKSSASRSGSASPKDDEAMPKQA